ncbi:MAG: hypothetical protein ABI978_03330 [Chloroflexota bacterium]
MIRRLLIPLIGSGLLLAAGAGTALGKCEGPNPPSFCQDVVAELNVGPFGVVHAGTATGVDVSVWQGDNAFDALSVTLTFTLVGNGTMVSQLATATTVPGQWHADMLLPSTGTWAVVAKVIDRNGIARNLQTEVVQVTEPPVAPPGTPVTPPPTNPTLPALPIALLVAALAVAGLLAGQMRSRARRRTAGAAGGAGGSASTATRDRA